MGIGKYLLSACIFIMASQLWGQEVSALKSESLQINNIGQLQKNVISLDRQIAIGFKDANPEKFVELADSFGKLVAGARDLKAEQSHFEQLEDIGERLHQACRRKVRYLEELTHENERELEDLYRSRLWYRINYALSSYRYWQAWIDLAIAERLAGKQEQLASLLHAEQGFRAVSVRILYPGLVYGSSLGLGYVALARGDQDLAEERFLLLKKALLSDPDNLIHETLKTELAIIALRKGDLLPEDLDENQPLTPKRARVISEEAFALLEQHRIIEQGAIAAARRLNILLKSNHLSDSLVTRLMTYKDEIVGQDIGVLGLLVDAEYAYAYQQYDTAVLKLREFIKVGGLSLPIGMNFYRYHYAVSLQKIGLHRDALHQVELLQAISKLPGKIVLALPKLHFTISQSLFKNQSSEENERRLIESALRFITLVPGDQDVSYAYLALARTSQDSEVRDKHMAMARKDKRLQGEIRLILLQLEIKGFNDSMEGQDTQKQIQSATRVLSLIKDLPRKQRKLILFKVLAIQMRNVIGEDGERLLEEIEKIESKGGYKEDTGRLLLSSKLRVLDSLQTLDRLQNFIEELARQPRTLMVDQEVIMFLLEKERKGDFLHLAEIAGGYLPALVDQPGDQRQLMLMRIRALSRSDQQAEAFQLSQQMIDLFPRSGDAWISYAQAAESMGQLFEAERGWAKITGAVPEGSDKWLDGMIQRVGLSTRLNKKESVNCSLIDKVENFRDRMSQDSQQTIDHWKIQNHCSSEQQMELD